MDKKIIIAGVGVVVVAGFLYMRAKNKAAVQAANSEGQASVIQSTGSVPYADASFTSLSPISGGISSGSYDMSNLAPSNQSNSGSGSSGGGFDFGAVFDKFLGLQSATQNAQIKANSTTSDSAILASILKGSAGGTISHSGDSTNITIDKGNTDDAITSIVKQEYKNTLGRDADAAGLAYWTNALYSGSTVQNLREQFVNSQEYKDKNKDA